MPEVLSRRLPEPPKVYDQVKFTQLIREIQATLDLASQLQSQYDAETAEMMDYFLR